MSAAWKNGAQGYKPLSSTYRFFVKGVDIFGHRLTLGIGCNLTGNTMTKHLLNALIKMKTRTAFTPAFLPRAAGWSGDDRMDVERRATQGTVATGQDMKQGPVILLVALSLLAVFSLAGTSAYAGPNDSPRIKKCQDAGGRWHYGDTADALCKQSKVVEINKQGITTKEIAAPLTADELKQRELNKSSVEAEKKKAEEQARQDQLLLATYGHEDDISFVRDRKIADIEGQVLASKQTLASLSNALKRIQAQAAEEQRGGKPVSEASAKHIANIEAQIAKHEQYVALKKQEEEATRIQANKDTVRYRELKKIQPPTTPAPAVAK